MKALLLTATIFLLKPICVFLYLLVWHCIKVAINKVMPDCRLKTILLTPTAQWAEAELAKRRAERLERERQPRD